VVPETLSDPLVRAGIRVACRRRLASVRRGGLEAQQARLEAWLGELRASPVAIETVRTNAQHYEVAPELFRLILGPRLKYSCCLWPQGVESLAHAEEAMLALSCRRAGVEDGMEILDLGCGWGSLSGWLAQRYPSSRILAVSNSARQRATIEALGLANVEVVTADANGFEPGRRFDRVLSIEMMEHTRNWETLLQRVASWLHPDGRVFVHVFTHRRFAYPYERGWMARNFFSGGQMPSHELLFRFSRHLGVEESWVVPGRHYARTAEAWLANLDDNRAAVRRLVGPRGYWRWRAFLLACAELWGYGGGAEWQVSHYRLAPGYRVDAPAPPDADGGGAVPRSPGARGSGRRRVTTRRPDTGPE
jgi:cyclopropane-fatty-acyl-phospholipid synthase